MANPVYSAQFILYTADTPNNEYIVPDGFTAVIRQISGYQAAGGWILQVNIQNSLIAPPVVIAVLNQEGVVNYVSTEGRWVVPEGGLMEVFFTTIGSTPTVYVGGYLIRNTYTS